MTRWTVRKERTMFWDEDDEWRYDHRWHVTSPTGVSWGNYATQAEAMARADKQARTITVTLPRQNFKDEVRERTALGPAQYRTVTGWFFPQHQVALVHDPESDAAIYYLVDDTTQQQRALLLRREEWVDVATALLALAEKENNE